MSWQPPPPPEDAPDGEPVPGLAPPSGAIVPPYQPPTPPVPPVPPGGGMPAPPGGPGLPAPPGGWIDIPGPPENPYGAPPPPPYGAPPAPPYGAPPAPPYGAPPAPPYGTGYQTYQPGFRPSRNFAGFWPRLGANFIDGLVVGIVPAVIYVIGIATAPTAPCTYTPYNDFGTGGYTTCTQVDGSALLPFIAAAGLLYLVLAFFVIIRPIGTTGQSIGGRATSVRVVDSTTGQPIGVGRALGRHLAAMFLSGWCCNLGYLWMLWDDQKQTWHDKLTSSIVVTS